LHRPVISAPLAEQGPPKRLPAVNRRGGHVHPDTLSHVKQRHHADAGWSKAQYDELQVLQ
jgi:hypothetical protein